VGALGFAKLAKVAGKLKKASIVEDLDYEWVFGSGLRLPVNELPINHMLLDTPRYYRVPRRR